MRAWSAGRNSRTHAKRRHVCATLRCGNSRTHAKQRHVCATRMYAPPASHKKHHKKTLTPNDQSARLFVSMGEGRLALAVASLYAHAYSHGDSYSPAFGP